MIKFVLIVSAMFVSASPSMLFAQGKVTLVREAAEFVMSKFTKEAGGETLETLTRQIQTVATKYGDEGLEAARKVGPRSFKLIEESGENGPEAVRLMAKYGGDAVCVVGKKSRLAISTKYGDDAANAMIKHGEIAEPLINEFGKPAATALKDISPQNARRISMLRKDGDLASIGRTSELLKVVANRGDDAMDFIWRNKKPLAAMATATAFLADPDPFIDGTAKLGGYIFKPIAENTNWTLVILFVIGVAVLPAVLRHSLRRKKQNAVPSGASMVLEQDNAAKPPPS